MSAIATPDDKAAVNRKSRPTNHPPVISDRPADDSRAVNQFGTSTGKPGRQ